MKAESLRAHRPASNGVLPRRTVFCDDERIVRYVVPIIFFIGAGVVYYYNDTHQSEYLLFPFLDVVPALRGNLEAQATWSWRIFAAIGAIILVTTIVQDLRQRRRTEE
jgi:hypothetical protein